MAQPCSSSLIGARTHSSQAVILFYRHQEMAHQGVRHRRIWVAEADQRIVGTLYIQIRELFYLVVDLNYRRLGSPAHCWRRPRGPADWPGSRPAIWPSCACWRAKASFVIQTA